MNEISQQRAWYREFWVWVVIALPAAAVVAGVATVVIANTNPDSLVVDDFQKVGLVARRESASDREAQARGLLATVSIDRASGEIALRLDGETQADVLSFSLHHATRRDFDRTTRLARDTTGLYRGNIGGDLDGRWYVQIASGEEAWRMTGALPAAARLVEIGTANDK